jgi:hypothetical protein
MNRTIHDMASEIYDLAYDPNEVGPDFVVECWISLGPRAADANFDPTPGAIVIVGDNEEQPLKARVIRRDGDRVWVQVELPGTSHAVA